MSNLGRQLLNSDGFPENREKNLDILLDQVKRGNLSVSLSSFEDIYNQTPLKQPFPIGCVKFNDKTNCFVFSWRDDFTSLGLSGVEEYSIKVRNYPTDSYPILSIIVGIHCGKVDSVTNEDLWYYGECHLDISFLSTRIKLYQFLNSHEILFCLFDGSSDNLDSYGFSVNKNELKNIEEEVNTILSVVNKGNLDNHIKNFSIASKVIHDCFTEKGLPRSQDALNIYLNRKKISPKPNAHNWLEYLSI